MIFFNKIVIICFSLFCISIAAHAQSPKNKKAAIVFDESTGKVLHTEHADDLRHPASMIKKMTFYIVFEALRSGRLTMDTELLVSQYAASQPPCKVYLKPGTYVKVKDLIKAMVTKSANDASCVLAEELGGSIHGFVRMMNATARKLGMNKTVCQNPTGLPHPHQVTTAREMLILARALVNDFPEYYPLFSLTNFYFNGVNYRNHNRMLGVVDGMEGLKTGFVNASGFNISTTTKRGDRRIYTVVMGGNSWQERDRKVKHLIETAFCNGDHYLKHYEVSANEAPNREPFVQYLKSVEAQSHLDKMLISTGKPSFKSKTKAISPAQSLAKPRLIKAVWKKNTPKKFRRCSKRKLA